MEIQVLKENLQTAAQLVSRFTANKAQLPILSHVGIEAGDDGIYFSGTNLDIGIRMRVGGKIIKKGKMAVPAKLFAELVSSLGMGAVSIKSEDDMQLKVVTKKVKANIQGMSMNDFPELVSNEIGKLGLYKLEDLDRVYKRVGFCVSQDDTRPVLMGALWDFSKGRLVATDGYRLSLMDLKFLKGEGESLLMSGLFLREAIGVLTDISVAEVNLFFNKDKKQVSFVSEDVVVIGRIIEGNYPQYQSILPKSQDIKFEVDRRDFISTVKAAAIFARDNANIVKIDLNAGKLVVSANAPQVGENLVEMDVDFLDAGEGQIAFNSKYLLQALGAMESERVLFSMSDSLRPGLIEEVGVNGFRHVVMPVRVKE